MLACAVGVAGTIVAWRGAVEQNNERISRQFTDAADREQAVVEQRLTEVARTLRSLRGLLLASNEVTRSEWYTYLSAIQLGEKSPLLLGLAVIEPNESGDAVHVRYRDMHLLGIDFHWIRPEAEPVWAHALETSRETTRPLLIADDRLLDPDAPSRRATMLLAAHRPAGDEPRWVAADIDLASLLEPLGADSSNGLVIELVDTTLPDDHQLIHASGDASAPATAYREARVLELGASRWLLTVRATPAFIAARRETAPQFILGIGLLASVLFASFVHSLLRRVRAAVALAKHMSLSLHAREAEAEKLSLVAARTDNAVMILSSELRVEWANEAMLRMSGLTLDAVRGRSLRELVELDTEHESMVEEVSLDLAERRGRTVEVRLRFHDGQWRWVSADVQPTVSASGGVANIIIVARDITAQRESDAVLLHRTTHDDLTGLANRVYLMEHLHERLRQGSERDEHRFAVIYMDLDRFKVINDSLGHAAGDRFLTAVADRLRRAMSELRERAGAEHAIIARLGGDEFTVVIEGLGDHSTAEQVAHGLQRALALPFMLDGQEIVTSASIGIAISDPRYRFAEDLLRDADIAMYRAKAAGRARCELFDQTMHDDLRARLELENDLRHAIQRDEFELHYQPLVSMKTGELQGFEALLRWRHPERGLISPALFIPIAEETGLIVQLGRKVLASACAQLRAWQQRFPQMDNLSVSVNLSVKQLADPSLIRKIETILASTRIRPGSLKLEITESAIMDDLEAMRRLLSQLKALNVQLLMDDFGTGYSSLSCLHQFPFDGIKIDRSFIRSMNERHELTAVVMAIVALSHHLNMSVVAEGIETEEQLVRLQTLECDLGQGYYFARPLPVDEAERFIRRYLDRNERWRDNSSVVGPIPLHPSNEAAA